MTLPITDLPEYSWYGDVPLAAGVNAHRFAWMATALDDVRRPAAIRGEDTLIPGPAGVVVNRRRRTVSRRLIPVLFTGDVDSDGDPGGAPDEQVWVNFYEFCAAVVEPPDGDPRRTLSVVHGSLLWSGPAVVEDFDYRARGPAEIVGVLEVSLPEGRLTLGTLSS